MTELYSPRYATLPVSPFIPLPLCIIRAFLLSAYSSPLFFTACTFFGPSRKRGPPKGYIDAIEARLHQMEALIGIILASGDPRAEALLQDLKEVS
jgi:hypothetical protein